MDDFVSFSPFSHSVSVYVCVSFDVSFLTTLTFQAKPFSFRQTFWVFARGSFSLQLDLVDKLEFGVMLGSSF